MSYYVHAEVQCDNTTQVSSTIYYVPSRDNFSSDEEFERSVRLQGTGSLGDGTVLRYNGKIETLPKGCNTALGAAGRCLVPYFSIAADLRFYRAGDIVFIPEIRGQSITLPNGTEIKHPGYFIVDDTGGAIKGSGRFDFFTGGEQPNSNKNSFGLGKGFLSMADRTRCNKSFQVIRRESLIARPRWDLALEEMNTVLGNQANPHRLIARAKIKSASCYVTAQAESLQGAQK